MVLITAHTSAETQNLIENWKKTCIQNQDSGLWFGMQIGQKMSKMSYLAILRENEELILYPVSEI